MIIDANAIISACLGRSEPLFHALIAQGNDLFVPEHQMREAKIVNERECVLRGREPAAAFAWTSAALTVVAADIYAVHELEARARLDGAGQRDWPLLALAMITGDDVWSDDRDLFGTGIVTWHTRNIRRLASQSPDVADETGADHA